MTSQMRYEGLKFDLAKLPSLIITFLAKKLNTLLDYSGTILTTSVPINVDKRDVFAVDKRKHFFDVLRDDCGYDVELYEINFKGNRLLRKDRRSNFKISEKCVDVAIATNLFLYKDDYDIAVLLTGDKDFIPALKGIESFGKKICIVSCKDSCSQELQSTFENILWLDDILPYTIF